VLPFVAGQIKDAAERFSKGADGENGEGGGEDDEGDLLNLRSEPPPPLSVDDPYLRQQLKDSLATVYRSCAELLEFKVGDRSPLVLAFRGSCACTSAIVVMWIDVRHCMC
jgi:hypothetical protein